MPQPSIFYSWQSDTPRESTRDAVRSAIELAISLLSVGLPVEDSPRIDHDTQGQSGTPSITETIFHKINTCAVLIADVTLVGSTIPKEGDKAKRLSNPNVLLELGYWAAILGWQRIILVLNKHYGSPESLPFDLKFRRFPLTYNLGPNSNRRQKVIDGLTERLEEAISACLAAEHLHAQEVVSRLPSFTRLLMHRHSLDQIFYETEADNKVISRLDIAITQLLELGIIRWVKANTASGLGYMWTYLGKRCIIQMGLPTLRVDISDTPIIDNSVLLNFSGYDGLDGEVD
jgi:hypothetical protein